MSGGLGLPDLLGGLGLPDLLGGLGLPDLLGGLGLPDLLGGRVLKKFISTFCSSFFLSLEKPLILYLRAISLRSGNFVCSIFIFNIKLTF